MKIRFRLPNVIKNIFLTLFAFIITYPILFVLLGSFKSNKEIMMDPFGLPSKLSIANYSKAWNEGVLYALFKNSIIVTFTSVILVVIFASFIAFVMSRENFKFKYFLYPVIIIGITVPYQIGILPLFMQLNSFHLTNTYLGLIIVYTVYNLPFSTFIMYGFFKHISKDIQEAAAIDGCGNFRMYFNIIMPLSPAVITTVCIFNLMFIWNDMFFALVLIRSKFLKTLTVGLFAFQGQYMNDYATMFAGIIIVSLPMIILFLVLQKRFIEGIASGAVKG